MPAADDGEPKGKRNLVRWDDDKDKQLLLSLQFACVNAGIRIPWDKVAKLMGPKFSGGACVQHLAKLRNRMQEEGIAVPPPLPRGMVTSTPSRVYSQATGGKRRRGAATADGDDDIDDFEPLNAAEESPKPAKKRKVTKKEPDIKEESEKEGTPELYDSDGEYGAKPKKASKAKPKPKKAATKKNNRRKSTSQDAQETVETAPTPAIQTRGVRKNYAQMDAPIEEEEDVKAVVAEVTESADVDAAKGATMVEEPITDKGVAAVSTEAAAPEPVAQLAIPQSQATQAVAPLTPSSEQGPDHQAMGRNQVADNSVQYSYQDMGGSLASMNPQWSYNVPVSSVPSYNMAQAGYMSTGPSQFMYGNSLNDQKHQTPTGTGMLGLFNNAPSTPTSISPGQLTFNNSPSNLQKANPMGGAGATSFLQSDFDFSNAASRAVSRNNSKESIRSQETLMGMPNMNDLGAGDQLDLSVFNTDMNHDDDDLFGGFLDFNQGS